MSEANIIVTFVIGKGIFLEGFTDSTIDSISIAVFCIIVLTAITSTINYRTITKSID